MGVDESVATQVGLDFVVERRGVTFDREEFHLQGERVMAELVALEGCNDDIRDGDVSTDARTGLMSVGVLVRTGDELVAHRRALEVIRTALHAAGVHTPDWPQQTVIGRAGVPA